MMSKRIIVLFAGMVVAYFTIYMGDGVYEGFMAASDTERGAWGLLRFIGGILALVLGGISCGGALMTSFDKVNQSFDGEHELPAAAALVFVGYAFGAFAGPFSNYGPYPWYWISHWDVLVVIAMMPTVMSLGDIIADINDARLARKAVKAVEEEKNRKVIPLGRQ